jgi:hypothetical protein
MHILNSCVEFVAVLENFGNYFSGNFSEYRYCSLDPVQCQRDDQGDRQRGATSLSGCKVLRRKRENRDFGGKTKDEEKEGCSSSG